jgi:hypothetical protein
MFGSLIRQTWLMMKVETIKIITSFPTGPFRLYPQVAKSQFFTIILLSSTTKEIDEKRKCLEKATFSRRKKKMSEKRV